MEHLVQFTISVDDENIVKHVSENAEKKIIADLKKEVGRRIFQSDGYSLYCSTKGYDEHHLNSWAQSQFTGFLEHHKDEIILLAAKDLANRLARSKAGKAILEEIQ